MADGFFQRISLKIIMNFMFKNCFSHLSPKYLCISALKWLSISSNDVCIFRFVCSICLIIYTNLYSCVTCDGFKTSQPATFSRLSIISLLVCASFLVIQTVYLNNVKYSDKANSLFLEKPVTSYKKPNR